MENEIWKDVIGYEGHYVVSSLGRVNSIKKEPIKNIKPSIDGSGYEKITLYKNNIPTTFKIHQLVARAFLNHIPCGHKLVVNHIDFNKVNNRLCNLEIISQRENANKKHIKSISKYIGVTWDKSVCKWKSQITINGKNKNLGRFDNEIDAHIAYKNCAYSSLSNL